MILVLSLFVLVLLVAWEKGLVDGTTALFTSLLVSSAVVGWLMWMIYSAVAAAMMRGGM